MNVQTRKSPYMKFLSASVSASALLLASAAGPVFAEAGSEARPVTATAVSSSAQSVAEDSVNPTVETNRYFMRLMTQIFDGSKDFSHTQMAAFARKRQGNISWTMLDFGDGAVVITQPDTLSVSGFKNTSKAEFGVLYNYDTKTIDGNSPVANFHNTYVRPQLDRAPALGSNIGWSTQMPLSALGVPGVSGQQVKLELSREYFTHDGKEMVLLQYKVPALRFDSGSGTTVVHWGRGFALTDPGFGNIYASAALHRSVADEGDSEQRPYRYYRSGFASNNDGKMMLDIKKIPAVAEIYDDYFGETALEVIPYDDDIGAADQRPVALAANIDVMALSIAENGANDGGTLAGAQTGVDRGQEETIPPINDKGDPVYPMLDAANRFNQGVTGVKGAKVQITVSQLETLTNSLAERGSALGDTYDRFVTAEQDLKKNAKTKPKLTPSALRRQSIFDAAVDKAKRTRLELDDVMLSIEDYTISGEKTPQALLNEADNLRIDLIGDIEEMQSANRTFSEALSKPGAIVTVLDLEDANTLSLVDDFRTASKEYDLIADELPKFFSESENLVEAFKATPLDKLTKFVAKFGDSPTGKFLDKLGHAFNFAAIGSAGINSYTAATTNIGSGKSIPLTRDYATLNPDGGFSNVKGAAFGLFMDIVGLAGNAGSGNFAGFASDASAISLGSITDIVISVKGIADVNAIILKNEQDMTAVITARTRPITLAEAKKLTDLKATPYGLDALTSDEDPYKDGYDLKNPNFDPDTGLPDDAYWAYLKENEPQTLVNLGIDPNAPVGGWPPNSETTKEDTDLSRNELIAGLDDEFKERDYPTAPTRDPNASKSKPDPAEGNLGKTSELSQAQLDDIATTQRRAAAQAKLDAEQAERSSDLPPLDNFETSEERQAFYQQQLDAAQAERAADLPPVDTFETPAERQAYYQQKLDEAQIERSQGLPPSDNFKTSAERQAYYKQQLDAAQAERTSGLPTIDNFKTPAERQAYYQNQLDDAQAERTSELPPLDTFKTPEERRIANQKILENQQTERTKDLPELDNFKTPEERKEAFQKQLDETLEQRLADRNKESDRERGAPLKISELKTSDLKVSSFDIKPVVFTKVTFEDVNFDKDNDLFDEDGNLRKVGPDDFEMTAFNAPDISGFEFTNFADDDYPGGNHIPAFTYENMSGTVEIDLDQWAEWLLTQDIAKLERLARQAGYPNLASALNDAANIIKLADDDGYRKWALTQPPCSPSGCGPNYQGLWAKKRSTLALGDILRADRAFFSSAGLSDISIEGLRLMFSIIDFGIDDGDRVNIAVSQFGRSLLNQSLTINTGGTAFDIPVQRGVVAVNMTALNTGEFPPNTAALSIQGVSGGDSAQDFSLQDGDTAGLRVTVGGK